MDSNLLVFKNFKINGETAIEPVYDLTTGHVAAELVKANATPPQVSEAVWQICRDGEEVIVVDEKLRNQMANLPKVSHGTHFVGLPETNGGPTKLSI